MTKKIGILFGAGAEISYGMPSGGKFALDIFRQSSEYGKERLRKMRNLVDPSSAYASNWLPQNFSNKSISSFGQRVFDSIMIDTIGNNRNKIITNLSDFDKIANDSIISIYGDKLLYINRVEKDLASKYLDINISQELQYNDLFKSGNKLFENKVFAVLLTYYKYFTFQDSNQKNLFKKIIMAIFQLQLGALSENLSRNIEESLFDKNTLNLDFFDDLGGTLNVNYEMAGIEGLKILSETDIDDIDVSIIKLSYSILENIYADILDYKSLIDSHWHYLYNPRNEWAKFSKIVVFLYTVHQYIVNKSGSLDSKKDGYYDDVENIIKNNLFELTKIGTTNYSPFIQDAISSDVIFLNGGTNIFYDPYINSIVDENTNTNHIVVPLLFTQSGTKPMTSIDMSQKYVDFYNTLQESDFIVIIGFGFNADDEHINGIFRQLIDKHSKTVYIVDLDSNNDILSKKERIQKKLKIEDYSNINFITVDKITRKTANGKFWYEEIK